jgi:hypothetical protein
MLIRTLDTAPKSAKTKRGAQTPIISAAVLKRAG